MGCAVGDCDNDGDPDLLVTNYGFDVFYRNNGNGQFSEVSSSTGLDDSLWSTGAAFGDVDLDGDLDLYVVHYVAFDPARQTGEMAPYLADLSLARVEGEELPAAYPRPSSFPASPDRLLHNKNGQFADISDRVNTDAIVGRGLGVVFGDYNLDGWPDLYVANDGNPNFLYHNRGDGTFEEVGAASGTAYGLSGQAEAGMELTLGLRQQRLSRSDSHQLPRRAKRSLPKHGDGFLRQRHVQLGDRLGDAPLPRIWDCVFRL